MNDAMYEIYLHYDTVFMKKDKIYTYNGFWIILKPDGYIVGGSHCNEYAYDNEDRKIR